MNILIDIGHPAHVHLFRHFAQEMRNQGHSILFTCREKEFEIDLLSTYRLNFQTFGKKYSSFIGKFYQISKFGIKEYIVGLKFRPDILLSHGSIYAAHAAFFLKKPHIALEDTFNFEQIKLYLPFTQTVLVGDYGHPRLGKKEISFAGYHELAYLHPNRFVPDKNIYNLLGIKETEKYVILRFVAWNATHDYGHNGISYENKLLAIHEFEKYAKVFISSESELPQDLEKYKLEIRPHQLHDALAYASLVWAESFTIPSECSVLGVPSIVNHDTKSYYLSDQENRYGLCSCFTESEEDQLKAISHATEILQTDRALEHRRGRARMLDEKIDVTAFMVWFVENYPQSAQVMRENPDYQYRFK